MAYIIIIINHLMQLIIISRMKQRKCLIIFFVGQYENLSKFGCFFLKDFRLKWTL